MKRLCATRLVLLAMLLASASARATILTFDAKGISNNQPFPVGYGDNIDATKVVSGDAAANTYGLGNGATPNVTVGFTPSAPFGSDAFSSFYYYSDADWPKVAELYTAPLGDNINVFEITFTPDAGYLVQVNSFDLYDYPNYHNGEDHTVGWRVLDGASVLASGSVTVPSTVSPTVVPVGSVMSNGFAGTVVLELTHSAGFGADLGLDNVNFDQSAAVPEPSVIGLMATGLLVLLRTAKQK